MRSLAFNAFFFVVTFVVAMAAWAVAKTGDRTRLFRIVHRWGRLMRWAVETILDARIEVRGLEHLDPDRSQLIVSKHQSELDIIMLCALVPEFSAVAMRELADYPFFGPILRTLDVVLVRVDDGHNRAGRTRDTIEGGRRMVAQGRPMVIYPEGHLMALGDRERYRSGAGHLYEAMGVEAVPCAVSLGVIWPQRKWRKHPRTTGAIAYLDPIPPGMEREAFMAEIERRIERATMALIREHAPADRLAEAERRHRAAREHEGPAQAAE